MDEGLAATDNRVASMAADTASMPNFGALDTMHSSLSNMGQSRKKR